ncbi:MAG: tRNA pseudouridine(38-40) synthase TruA [Spirochaetota bacterium]
MSVRIKCTIAYDGTRYAGWQIQPDDPTVQAEVERAAAAVVNQRVGVVASGRTDSGVHARGQVCHFDSPNESMPPEKYALALNRHLPADIRVLDSSRVTDGFHARYSAVAREYRYYLLQTRIADPFERPYCYCRSRLPAPGLLDGYAAQLVGRHDFTTFSAAGDESSSKLREVYSAGVYIQRGVMVFRIVGNAFLWRMVRSLVGTMLELGQSGEAPARMAELLRGRNRNLAGVTAPPYGLFLHKVSYGTG